MERAPSNHTPLGAVSAELREAIASHDLDRIAHVLAARARVLVEFAASASPTELAEAQADNAALSNYLANEKLASFAEIRRSQTLRRALSHNLPIGDPRQRGTLA